MSRMILMAAAAITCTMTAATGAGAQTDAPPAAPAVSNQQNLRPWMEAQFLRVGQSCFNRFRARDNRTVIPADVLLWGSIQSRLDTPYTVHNGASLNSLFARVYRVNNGRREPVGQEIGITWASSVPPVVYEQTASAQRRHNCTTMLSANARTELRLDVAEIRAALEASMTNNSSLTAFVYSGRMISPIAASTNLVTTVTRTPNGIAPFGVLASIWNWYNVNRDMIDAGTAGNLRIINELQGVAFYQVTGLNQTGYLNASASAAGSFLVFSASAGAQGQVQQSITGTVNDFAVALSAIPEQAYTRLPGPAEIAANATERVDFRPAATDVRVEGPGNFRYAVDLYDLPQAYCNQSVWSLSPPEGTVAARGQLRLTEVRTADAAGVEVCRFTVNVTPPATPSTVVEIPLAVKWSIVAPTQNATAIDLVLAPRETISVPDYRASITIGNAAGPNAIVIPAAGDAAIAVPLTYWLLETQGRRAAGLVPTSARLRLTCGTGEPRVVPLRGDAASWVRGGDGSAKILVSAELSRQSLQSVQAGTPAQCTLAGDIDLTVEGSSSIVHASLIPVSFEVSRTAPIVQPTFFERSVQ